MDFNKLNNIRVIKRDGREKPFEMTRIVNAITKSYKDEGYSETCEEIDLISKELFYDFSTSQKNVYTVEEIQDMVVDAIKEYNNEVATKYQEYRKWREEERLRRSQKEKFYTEILQCSNVDNDNANVNQYSFSGKKYRIADHEQKTYALRNLISDKGRKAFEEGLIYYHDLSSYAIGEFNCSFVDLDKALGEGFATRNGDVRPASNYATACQLIAVVFQITSQSQYGGVASNHLDFTLAPYVKKSFVKLFKEGYSEFIGGSIEDVIKEKYIYLDNKDLKNKYPKIYDYALRHLRKEGRQSTEALYHNLNTLESRAGSQLPFTSINLGRDTSTEGKLVNEWIFNASIEGIGKLHQTSIFPISIFQYKKGENARSGDANYCIKKLALESLTKRIYPNICNCDYKQNVEDPNNPDTFFATMGCRTMLGYDINSDSYIKTGRGNISPITIILPKLGLDYGIALGKRDKADVEGFFKKFDETLDLVRDELIIRYKYIAKQNPKSAPFIYENGLMMDADKCKDTVKEYVKHGTNAIGILGMAECCVAMFGKHHGISVEAYKFALKLVRRIYEYCKKATHEYKINFSTYFSPSESLCKTAVETLKIYYGEVKGVTDKKYFTNSIHMPVNCDMDAYSKITIEAPFTQYGTGGCITYVELDSNTVNNIEGIEKLIDYAMDLNIPYLALNFPIDTCNNCGYSSQITSECCPKCGSKEIKRLKRVTGYLSVDYRNFNEGKFQEVEDRVVHNIFNPDTIPVLKQAQKELEEMGIAKFEIQ